MHAQAYQAMWREFLELNPAIKTMLNEKEGELVAAKVGNLIVYPWHEWTRYHETYISPQVYGNQVRATKGFLTIERHVSHGRRYPIWTFG